MSGKKGLPPHMVSHKGGPREENGEEYEEGCVEAVRRERYGELQVSVSGSEFYVMEPLDDSRYRKVGFQKGSEGRVSEVVDELLEGRDLQNAAFGIYGPADSIYKKLNVFTDEDGKLPDSYRESFREINEDWFENSMRTIDSEAREQVEYLLEEEGHGQERVCEILANTYGVTPETIDSRYAKTLVRYR